MRYLIILLIASHLVSCKARQDHRSTKLNDVTRFSSDGPDVDLTTYTEAGEAEYDCMRKEVQAVTSKYDPTYSDLEKLVNKAVDFLSDTDRESVAPQKVPLPELVAIRVYTGSKYREINAALRSRDWNTLPQYRCIILSASSGLNKMLPFTGTVNRAATLPDSVVSKYVVGEISVERHFWSSTFGDSDESEFRGNVRYEIKSMKGRRIDWLSEFPDEKEVLFTPGSEFRVTEKSKRNDKTIISVEQTL